MKNDRQTFRQQYELEDDNAYCDRNIREQEYDDYRSWEEKNHLQLMIRSEKSLQIAALPSSKQYSTRMILESLNANKLRHKAGEPDSNIDAKVISEQYSQWQEITEFESAAAMDFAGPKKSRRNGYWCPGYAQNIILSRPWDSIMVESVRLVLQRWRGVCSFSQTMRGYWSGIEHEYVYHPTPEKQSRPVENGHAQIKLKGSEV